MKERFSSQYSEIPDMMWKKDSSESMKIAAIDFWYSTRHPNKLASSTAKKIIDVMADPNFEDVASSVAGGLIGAGSSLYSSGKVPQSKELRVSERKNTSTPTREQLSLRADRAALLEEKSQGKNMYMKEKYQQARERVAELRAENRLLSAVVQGGLGASLGVGLSRLKGQSK
jgi:hypothetical protein